MGSSQRVAVYATAQGGRETSETIVDSAARLGYESDQQRPPAQYPVHFVDFPFTDEGASFQDHLDVVEREQPEIAVAPDVEGDRDPDAVFHQADELANHADVVVVVPKSIHPEDVPDRYRVGVPLADYGSDAPWQLPEYADAGDLHLLGGSPTVQMEASKFLRNVASLDGASVFKGAEMGNIWAPKPDRNWHPTGDLQAGYYDRVGRSLDNVVRAWADRYGYDPGIDPELDVPVDADELQERTDRRRDQIDTEEGYHRSGARGAPPAIHPDDADLWMEGDSGIDHFEIRDFDAERQEAIDDAIEAMRTHSQKAGLDRWTETDPEAATDGGQDDPFETMSSDDSDTYDPSEEWSDDRPEQDTLADENTRASADTESRVDEGGSESFVDDRNDVYDPTDDQGGEQASLVPDEVGGGQQDLTGDDATHDPEYLVENDEPEGPFDAEDQGRLIHHSEQGNLGPLIRTIGVSRRMDQPHLFSEAGLEDPADWLDDDVDFTEVEGIGSGSAETIEDALPYIREGVEQRDDVQADAGDDHGDDVEEIDPNDRDAFREQLESLDGISSRQADNIANEFFDLEDLLDKATEYIDDRVKYVGPATVESIRDQVGGAVESDDGDDGTTPLQVNEGDRSEDAPFDVEVPEEINGWELGQPRDMAGWARWENTGAAQDGQHTVEIVADGPESHWVEWFHPDGKETLEQGVREPQDAVDVATDFMGGMESPADHLDDGADADPYDPIDEWGPTADRPISDVWRDLVSPGERRVQQLDDDPIIGPGGRHRVDREDPTDPTIVADSEGDDGDRNIGSDVDVDEGLTSAMATQDASDGGVSVQLTEDEQSEVKKAARWGERNSRDLPREQLRSIRGLIGEPTSGPVTMSADQWDLLADALADYSVDGVGTPEPDAVTSLTTKAIDAAEGDGSQAGSGQDVYDPMEDQKTDSDDPGASEGDDPVSVPDVVGSWSINDVDAVDGGYRYHYVGEHTDAKILPDGDGHKLVVGDGTVEGIPSVSDAIDNLRDRANPDERAEPIEFGTLDAANEFRDDHEGWIHGTDNRSHKTVKVDPDAPDDVLDDAGMGSLVSSQTGKKYGQMNLTDHERSELEDRDGWKWGSHGFHAMSSKAVLVEEGGTPWLDYYSMDLEPIEHVSVTESGKDMAAQQGLSGPGETGMIDDSDMDMEEVAQAADKGQGEACTRARDYCEDGHEEACAALLEDCDWTEDEIEQIMDAAREMGEEPSEIYDPVAQEDTGQSFEEWARENEPADADPDVPEKPDPFIAPPDEELAKTAPTSTPDQLQPAALRALKKAWTGYKAARGQAREAHQEAEHYAAVINGIRSVNDQEPLDFDQIDEWDGGRVMPDDPTEEYPAPEGGEETMGEAAEHGHASNAAQTLLGQFSGAARDAAGSDPYDPTGDL